MTFTVPDDDFVTLSMLEHYSYCPKQAFLISSLGQFEGSDRTSAGDAAHQRTDSGQTSYTKEAVIRRSLPLYHEELGIYGVADVVEFSRDKLSINVVEHKVGYASHAAHIQLCAQALCLATMYPGRTVNMFTYAHRTQKRELVRSTKALEEGTLAAIAAARALLRLTRSPAGVNDQRCRRCSLREICLPVHMFGVTA